jgi:hypothetical protein
MGFLDTPLPRTKEAYLDQAEWIGKIRRDADKMGYDKETILMLDKLYILWEIKASKIG